MHAFSFLATQLQLHHLKHPHTPHYTPQTEPPNPIDPSNDHNKSSIHPIPLLLFILLRQLPPRLRLLPLLLREIRPIKRTSPPQPQPRPHTLQIKQMSRMTRQPHNKRVLILQERIIAYRTDLGGVQRGTGDAVEFYTNNS